ncbi:MULTISPECIES: hypothetical protein [unclassified Anaerobiospirillum]|uniref:hypothetical protein n=1 Tax=unclassified Anaerobiospirillum TaxID=2647410 RepID=UPI001FF4855D|nr:MULTISPECIES: hypothetical protein [unclassified Anaerobiospirillum]MCK0533999.1 hypothetical protein [Anaerobiospirillum sp. NML120511]MCK0539258.1 hypothetical protein [Anaerobiospirillum sp. NML02-A-032]
MLFKKTVIAAALSACLAVTGCNSTSGSSSSSGGADPRLTSKEFNVDGASYGVACLSGAAVSGIGCLLLKGGDKKACIAVAALGCGAGMGANALMDKLRSNYNTREEQLDGLIATMEDSRQKAAMMASTAQAVYAEDQEKFKLLQAQIKKSKADRAELEKTVARYDANIKILKENLDYHNKSLASYKEVRSQIAAEGNLTPDEKQRIKECDQQIARLQKSIKEIEGAYLAYSEDSNVLHLTIDGGSKAA